MLTAIAEMTLVILAMAAVGLPAAVLLGRAGRDPALLVARTLLCGLAYWVVAFWWLRLTGGTLAGLLLGGAGIALVFAVAVRRRLRSALAELRLGRREAVALTALVGVTVLRLVPMLQALVPPGGDMSMHATMAMLIRLADGVPTSYRPLLPIDEFGSYAAGLPTLAALLARVTAQPVVTAAFFVSCCAHALVSWAFYAALRTRLRPGAAVLAALLASCATCDPQFIFRWGGNPTVLSLAFALPVIPPLVDGTFSRVRRRLVPVALLAAGAALTHAVVPYALAWVVATVAVARGLTAGRRRFVRGAVNGVLAVSLTLALTAPYLAGFAPPLSPDELATTHRWQLLAEHVPPGDGLGRLLHLSGFLGHRLGEPIMLWTALALGLCLGLGRRPPVRDGVFALAVLLLVFNAFVWLLPASYVLYPDRLLLLLLWPIAAVIGRALAAVSARTRAVSGRWRTAQRGLTALALATIPLPFYAWYLLAGPVFADVTPPDLAAIRWLAANVPPGVVIGTNSQDAGRWVPALIARPVTGAHVHFLYEDEVHAWLARLPAPPVVLVGAKAGPGARYTNAAMASDPAYREVFRAGPSAVFVHR